MCQPLVAAVDRRRHPAPAKEVGGATRGGMPAACCWVGVGFSAGNPHALTAPNCTHMHMALPTINFEAFTDRSSWLLVPLLTPCRLCSG